MKFVFALATACALAVLAEHSASVHANKDLVFTAKEKQAVAQLRAAVADVDGPSWLKADWNLIHYLRAFKMDVSRSADAIRETATWRREAKIDSILKEKILDLNPPFDTDSKTKDGSPVMIWLPARWDIRKQMLAGNREKMIRYFDQMNESAHAKIRASQAQGGNVTQWFQILDLHNYNLRQHACVTCFPLYFEWVSHWEKHYPAAHQHFIYINTPRTFMPLLELLKPLYSVPTRNALQVQSAEKEKWYEELSKYIDDKEIPKIWGGSRPFKLGDRDP
jgi:hypothetical protein